MNPLLFTLGDDEAANGFGGAETELDTEWYGSGLAWSKDEGALPLEVTILLSGMTKTHFNLESINWLPSVSFHCKKEDYLK